MQPGHHASASRPRLGRVVSTALVVTILLIGGIINVGQHAPPGELGDLGSFLHAGALGRTGQNPYGPYAQGINLNAPFSVLPFQWAAQFGPETVYTRWYFLSLGIYAAVLLLLWRAYPQARTVVRVVWAVVWGSLWSSLWDGQIYTLLTLIVTGAWLLLDKRRPIVAGLLIGLLCAIKPNYLVWPTLLAISGAWSAAVAAGASLAVLSAIPVVVYGSSVYQQWFATIVHISSVSAPANAAVPGALARLNAPAWAGLGASVLLLIGLAYWAWRTKPKTDQTSGVALAAAILASPLGWVDYTLLLLPVFWSRRWTWPLWCAALILVQFMGHTWWMQQASPWVLATLGQYATVAVLLVLVGTMGTRNDQRSTIPREQQRSDVVLPRQIPIEAVRPVVVER